MTKRAILATIGVGLAVIIGCVLLWTSQRAEHSQPDSSASVRTNPTAGQPAGNASKASGAADIPANSEHGSLSTRKIVSCHRALRQLQNVQRSVCNELRGDPNVAQERCRQELQLANNALSSLESTSGLCPKELAEPAGYFDALRDSAVTGDIEAQRCFIQGYFGESRDAQEYISQVQRDEYPRLARQFIDAALERGDWRVVRWLGRVRTDMADGLLHSAYPIGQTNPATIYKMQFLLAIGSPSDERVLEEATRITESLRREGLLTPEEIRDAEKWAEAMLDGYFSKGAASSETSIENFCTDR